MFRSLILIVACTLCKVQCFVVHRVVHNVPTRPGVPRKRFISRWTAGDVDADFERLENAINLDNAEDDQLAQQRVDTLDYIASSRIDIAETILSFVKGPLTLTFFLSLLFQYIAGTTVLRIVNNVSIFHFMLSTIVCPLVLLAIRSRKGVDQEPRQELPRSLAGLSDNYLKFITGYENPKLSCRDTVLCILELWSFTVLPSLLFRPWATPRRLLTRLGAFASLRLYPILSYKLWHQQPRPHSGMVLALRTATKMMSATTLFAIDAALLVGQLRPKVILYSYGLLLISGAFMVLGFRHVKPQTKYWRVVQKFRFPFQLLVGSVVAGIFSKHFRTVDMAFAKQSVGVSISMIPWRNLLSKSLAIISYFGVAWSLIDVRQNLCIAYTHNNSLSSLLSDDLNFGTSKRVVNNESSLRWRYWQSWRDPERIYQRIGSLYGRFWHWLLLEGSVEEQFVRTRQQNTPMRIVNLAKRDNTNLSELFDLSNKNKWKARAMDLVADEHRISIEDKSVSVRICLALALMLMLLQQDRLGSAIYLSFGIGLDFRFDHKKRPPKGTEPSTRLLQARAAKSAHKRAVELYDAEGINRKLAQVTDPEERKRIKKEMSQETQDEVEYMARRLTELIPRTSSEISADDLQSNTIYNTFSERLKAKNYAKMFLDKYAPESTGKESDKKELK